MEVTKREIIVSVSIFSILLIIGLVIFDLFNDSIADSKAMYNKAIKITDEELFKYGMQTNVGNAFIYGGLEAVDPVSYPEIKGDYLFLKKVTERHTKHTRVVTSTVNGKSVSRVETYWTWDVINTENKSSSDVKFLNTNFKTSQFNTPNLSHLDTIKESTRIRHKFYGYPAKSDVTIFAYLSNNNIDEKGVNIYNSTIEETLKYLKSDISSIVFWIIWIIITILCIYLFCKAENDWLKN